MDLVPSDISQRISRYFNQGLEVQRAEAVEDKTGFRLGVARRRFREGMTDADTFVQELRLLRVPESQIDLEVMAGELEFAYDYIMDLIATWRDAVRKGNIGIDRFSELISQVIVVPERAMTYVARELARLKPEAEVSLAPVPKLEYETDAGKVQVDTIRRLRRKNALSRDEEIAAFLELGMPIELANSYADNDDARLAEKT